MSDCMTFPDTVEEFMDQYKIIDTKQVYTNGIEFVPIFRMKQWFEHLPSAQPDLQPTCNQLATDCISRQAAIKILDAAWVDGTEYQGHLHEEFEKLPSSQPEQCADTVSRTAAIEAQERIMSDHPLDGYEDERLLINALKALPSVQPDLSSYSDKLWRNAYERGKAEAEQRWIPVSERLPESRVYVLVTYEYQYGLLDHGISWYEDKRKEWMSTREVTAWMPLPESYRGDEDGK